MVAGTGKRGRTNALIVVSPNGAFWFEEFKGNLNSAIFIEMLGRLMKSRRRKVHLVLDSHPAHVSRMTAAAIGAYGGKLEVHFLPGYSPELNPVEYVNNYVKATGPRKRLPGSVTELSEIVQSVLGSLARTRCRVKSFFGHRELKYI